MTSPKMLSTLGNEDNIPGGKFCMNIYLVCSLAQLLALSPFSLLFVVVIACMSHKYLYTHIHVENKLTTENMRSLAGQFK